MILVSDEVKSPGEQTHYQTLDTENYADTRVRRAFLWIKVDEIAKPKRKFSNATVKQFARKNGKKLHSRPHRLTFRHFFRLWVFRIAESNSVSVKKPN